MKRDEFGKIEYDERGVVEKYYPNSLIKTQLFWTCQRINIKNGIKRENSITVFKYLKGPHKIIDGDTTYEENELVSFPDDVKNELKKVDITTNCFGYAFFDGLFWVDPALDSGYFRIPVIENILESDNYKEIIYPEPNSIALFSRENNYWHVSKTDDGKSWYGKNGIKKPTLENIEDNIRQFGTVKFFKRIVTPTNPGQNKGNFLFV